MHQKCLVARLLKITSKNLQGTSPHISDATVSLSLTYMAQTTTTKNNYVSAFISQAAINMLVMSVLANADVGRVDGCCSVSSNVCKTG